MPAKLAQKREAFAWFDMTPQERFDEHVPFNQDELAKHLGIGSEVIVKWREEWKLQDKRRDAQVEALESDLDGADDRKAQEILDELHKLCTKDKIYRAGEVWLRAKGRLVDKSDVTHRLEIDADEHARIREEGKRRAVKAFPRAIGDRGVQPESALLSKEALPDTEQEHSPDG